MSSPADDLPAYLEGLNPEQREAVLHEGSSLLILAGAGTGKTRVITTKIAYLVREKRVQPESILAVTFTNKAAREMRERAAAIDHRCERAVIRTFHSFGAWFLRRNAAAANLDSNFTIYDDSDSAELVHAVFPSLSRQDCSRYASQIARAKDYDMDPDSPWLDSAFGADDLRRIYAAYQQRLRDTGNVDFGDLIRLPTRLLSSDPDILLRTRQRFRVVMVDEYQDSNVAQFHLLRAIAGPETYVCVVGDDDQSIYRFRGAEIRNILNFAKTFPGTSTVKLERNYRSYQSILDIAGDVVAKNSGRLGKTLRATRPGGERPKLALLDDQDQEVEFCSRLVRSHVAGGGRLSDIAILYRTNAQSLAFEKAFPRKGISYRLVGALRFYEREEVKDILAYLAFVLNPRDEVAFRRIVNKPARGIGDTGVDAILHTALSEGCDLLDACLRSRGQMRGRGKDGIDAFTSLIGRVGAMLGLGQPRNEDRPPSDAPYSLSDGGKPKQDSGSASLGEALQKIIDESGLSGYHQEKDEIAGTQKLANMEELVNAASMYPLAPEGLSEFLETIELDRSFQADGGSDENDAVSLITMHNTKGLEFPTVIVTGLEQGLFPRDDEEGEDLEEQRRLFYVALTRAKNRLFLSACRWRRIRGRIFETTPSRFLTEISPEFYEFWPGTRRGGMGRSPVAADRPQPTIRASRSEWRPGVTVYHDEYGKGSVVKVSETSSSGSLVVVRFETGKVVQFFPKYTKKLERISE